ncbi:hypothetical protein EDB86DRAFT_2895205 [Lactarius hatsudake]|nr:hypothetical protein EDB86DRAFT_2895205 [Lactarius hatsudake]
MKARRALHSLKILVGWSLQVVLSGATSLLLSGASSTFSLRHILVLANDFCYVGDVEHNNHIASTIFELSHQRHCTSSSIDSSTCTAATLNDRSLSHCTIRPPDMVHDAADGQLAMTLTSFVISTRRARRQVALLLA